MPDVQEIVTQWLREHGYDGLYCEECSCTVDDLAPCCSDIRGCKAGYKVPCPGPEECPDPEKCQFHIGQRKETRPDETGPDLTGQDSTRHDAISQDPFYRRTES